MHTIFLFSILKPNILPFTIIGATTRRSAQTSIVTADVEYDPTVCGDSAVNVIKEPDTPELIDTVESSV